MIEEIRANAHCARTLSRLSIGYRDLAKKYPNHRDHYIAESVRVRSEAQWMIARARRMKERLAP